MADQLHNATIQDVRKSSIKNRATNQNVFDGISSLLSKVYSSESETNTSGDFFGYVMYDNRLSVDQFKDLFQGSRTFMTKVLGGAATVNGTVLELYVDIPQVSDFLPRPNLNLLLDFIKQTRGEDNAKFRDFLVNARQEFDALGSYTLEGSSNSETPPQSPEQPITPSSAQSRRIGSNIKLNKIYKEFREVLEIITMYPKVYKYTETNEYLGFGSACKVHMPWDEGNDIQTMGYGYYKESIGGKIALTRTSIADEIKKIVKAQGNSK
jgi:hypothetical protein